MNSRGAFGDSLTLHVPALRQQEGEVGSAYKVARVLEGVLLEWQLACQDGSGEPDGSCDRGLLLNTS